MQHHVTVYAGSTLEEVTLPTHVDLTHVDTECLTCERFGIDDVRTLTYSATQRPVESNIRVFVIVTQKLPTESQNALLKLFEEPPATAEFYVVIPTLSMLLPTLRSRVQLVTDTRPVSVPSMFTEFLRLSYGERIVTIASFAKQKDTQRMSEILNGAASFATASVSTNPELSRRILFILTEATAPGASKKMLLEDLALLLPLST